jgi:hypothetical protein
MRSGRGAPVRGHSPRLPGFPADKLCPFGTLLPWAFPLPGLRTPRPRPPLRRAGRVSSPGPAIDRGIPLPVPAAHELGRRFPRHLLFSGLTARCLDHSGILFPRLSRSVYLPEVRHRSRSFDRPRVDPIFSAQTSRRGARPFCESPYIRSNRGNIGEMVVSRRAHYAQAIASCKHPIARPGTYRGCWPQHYHSPSFPLEHSGKGAFGSNRDETR